MGSRPPLLSGWVIQYNAKSHPEVTLSYRSRRDNRYMTLHRLNVTYAVMFADVEMELLDLEGWPSSKVTAYCYNSLALKNDLIFIATP